MLHTLKNLFQRPRHTVFGRKSLNVVHISTNDQQMTKADEHENQSDLTIRVSNAQDKATNDHQQR